MKKLLICMLMIMLVSCPALADTPEYVEGEVLVVLDAPMSAFSVAGTDSANAFSEALLNQAEALAGEFDLEVQGTYSEIARISGKNIVHFRSEYQSTEEIIKELSEVPYIVSIAPNGIRRLNETSAVETSANYSSSSLVPNDPSYSQQWGMKAIGMEELWDTFTGSDTVCVAVIDTGIDYTHPDISANMARDSRGNYGRYFKNGAQADDPKDRDGHGTHVAGIIGAVGNNNVGVAGINWRVKMLAVNVMANRTALDNDVIAGINYVLEERSRLNIRVANMSFGGWEILADTSPLGRAVKSLSDAGIICSIAVGNDSENISDPSARRRNQKVYPACFRFDNTISVGSFSVGYGKSSHSNYSTDWVDLAAPGETVYSTTLNGTYGTMTGTSMAAPHVAGAAAFLMGARPSETAAQIKTRLLSGARKLGISEGYWKSGILDVAGAYVYTGTNVSVTGVTLNKTSTQLGVGETEALYPSISPNNATNKSVTWSSNNTGVASVSTGGLVTARSTGNAVITVRTAEGNYSASCNVTVTNVGTIVTPTRVTLDKSTMTIPLGGSGSLAYVIEPSNATNKEVTWESNNENTATVVNGIVYAAQNPGTAAITVRTVAGNSSATCLVTVTVPATGVTLNKQNVTLGINGEELLQETVLPFNVTNSKVSWSSSNINVATVTPAGYIRGISAGTAIITVKTEDGGFTATCNVTVGNGGATVPAIGVTLNKPNMTLSVGGTETLTVTVSPTNATNKNVSWNSSNLSVASVSNGTVRGVGVGTTVITVQTQDGGYTASCYVTVSNGGATVPVVSVSLDKSVLTVKVGGEEKLTATVLPENATTKSVFWNSENADIAIVTPDGVVKGMKIGDTMITVTTDDNQLTDRCVVIVTEGDVEPPSDELRWVEKPMFFENRNSAADMMVDLSSADLEIIDGNVTVKKSIAESIYRGLKSDDMEDVNDIKIVPLPYFQAIIEPGKIAAVKIPVKGSTLDADTANKIDLLKILTPTTGELLQYVAAESEYDDGCFTLLDMENAPFTGDIVMADDYYLVIFIKDGGIYDLDQKRNGLVVDPTAIARLSWPGERGNDDDSGCSVGFGSGSISLLLISLTLFTARRKK